MCNELSVTAGASATALLFSALSSPSENNTTGRSPKPDTTTNHNVFPHYRTLLPIVRSKCAATVAECCGVVCMISSAYPDFPPLTLEYSRHHQLAGTGPYGIPINQLHLLSQRRTVPSGSALQYEEDKVTSLLSNYLTAQNLPFFPNTCQLHLFLFFSTDLQTVGIIISFDFRRSCLLNQYRGFTAFNGAPKT
ncbi:hypothetical protein T03_7304 [Trichinella britovi]|uniref:Uncharacterized protein n=1 Tax=Trichinella britovi TaxID=45882 RepID=A0A0V1CYH3_TRIBR|nr:hypothetical protein T03_7304 [Trichinella britovi]